MIELTETKPYSKQEAYNVVMNIAIKELDEDGFMRQETQRLLLFFSPNISRQDKAMNWLKKAVSPKDKHEECQYLHAHEGTLYAGSGVMMRLIETDMEDGSYEPRSLTKIAGKNSVRDSFIKRVLHLRSEIDKSQPDYAVLNAADAPKEMSWNVTKIVLHGVRYNMEFLKDCGESIETGLVHFGLHKILVGRIQFKGGVTGQYVVAPME